MTAYTSTQTGNFSSASTWGGSGYPNADGDTWTIASGHTVTYDVSSALTTGFGNCVVNSGATFQFASGARSIRFSGEIDVSGNWTQGSGHTVYLNGNSTRFDFLNPSSTTRVELVGSAPLPVTTTSGATTNRSGVIPVTSGSGFAEGEWIAVFKREHTSYLDRNDEGFIVHEVSGNNIYIRDFVSVRDTITSTDGTKVYLPNPDIWRVNQPVIFGTGSNRNTSTVASVNEALGYIELSDSVTGSVDGETIYSTGPLKSHGSGDTVRKIAMSVTASYTSGDTTISVSDATDIEAGDEIVVEGTSTNVNDDEYPRRYEVSSVSNNVITLTSGIEYTHTMDAERPAFVIKLTRDCRFVNENQQTVRFHRNTNSTRYQTRHLRDVEFDNCTRFSNGGNNRFYFEGYARGDTQTDGYPLEGLSVHWSDSYEYQNLFMYRENYNSTVRCCAVHNNRSWEGTFRMDQGYSSDNFAFFNNHASRSEHVGFQIDDTDGEHWEVAYNRSIGMDDDGFYVGTGNLWGNGFHHNSTLNNRRRGIRIGSGLQATQYWQNEVLDAGEEAIRCDSDDTRAVIFYNRILDPFSGNDFENVYSSRQTTQSLGRTLRLIDHNFHKNSDAIAFSGGFAYWDKAEKGWYHIFDNDAGEYGGIIAQIFVPAGSTLRARAVIKVVSGFSGTYPQLRIDPIPAREGSASNWDLFDSYSPQQDVAPVSTVAATSSDWQNVDATLTADSNKDRFVNVCMTISTDDASEGFYLRKVNCFLSGMVDHNLYYTRHRFTEPFRVTHRDTFTQAKKRIGGRIG